MRTVGKTTICFELRNVTDLELAEFNYQNVIFDLTVQHTDRGYRLNLEPCFGVSGYIEANQLTVQILEE